jgi:hypothetical protein
MEKKNRLGILAIVVLTALSIIADLLTLIPGAGNIVGSAFWAIAGVFFWFKGFGFVNPRRLAVGALSIIAEFIPGVQAVPTIAIGMIAIILMVRAEDKLGISLSPLQKKPGVTLPRGQKTPLNSVAGVRPPRKQQ